MKNIILAFLMLLMPLIMSAQRVIENPTFGAKGIAGLNLGVEKIVLHNDVTKLWLSNLLNFLKRIRTHIQLRGKRFRLWLISARKKVFFALTKTLSFRIL